MSLQGMKKYKIVYISTFTGLIINTLLDIPMILLLNKLGFYPYLGSMVATIIGQFITIYIALSSLRKEFSFSYRPIFNSFKKMIIPLILIIIPSLYISKYFVFNSRIRAFIFLAIAGTIYVGIYALITYKNKLLQDLLGDRLLKRFNKKSA